jgi:O-antigen/teichoic acid export membrane protein
MSARATPSDAPAPGGGGGGGGGLARATFLGFRADMVGAVSAVVLSILVARGLGPENRGIFFLAFLVATLVVIVGDLGMSAATIAHASKGDVSPGRLQGIAALFAIVLTGVAAVFLLPFQDTWTSSVLRGLDQTMLLLLVAGVGPQLFAQMSVALLQGSGRIPALSWIRIGYAIATPLLVGVAAIVTGDPAWTLGGWLATTVAYALALEVYLARAVEPPRLPSVEDVRRLLGFGLRGYVGTVAYHGFLRIDVLFLSARYGPRPVGIYSLSSIIAERIALLGQAVYGASAAPLGGLPRRDAAVLAADLVRLMLTVLVPAALVAGVLGFPAIPLIFGSDFSSAALPLALLLPGTVGLTCWYVLSLYIVVTLRRPGTTTLIQGAVLLVSLPLYYLAVREWEMTGAAVVSSCVYLSVFALGFAVLRATSSVRATDFVPRPADARRVLGFATASLRGRHA